METKAENTGDSLMGFDFGPLIQLFVDRGLDILFGVIILILGFWLSRIVSRTVVYAMQKRKMDPLICGFLRNIIYYAIVVAAMIAAVTKMGIPATSFVAVLGAAGLAIGLALQGSLSNFASGILLLVFHPFRVSDYVTVGGASGFVEEIGLLLTTLRTPDNKTIFVPNSSVLGGTITNNSLKPTRRVDMVFGIGYQDDINLAKGIINRLLEADDRILKDPAPTVAVAELGESSVNIVCRPWVNGEHYWDVLFELNEKVKQSFDAEGVSIPFPQRDVHLYTQTGKAE